MTTTTVSNEQSAKEYVDGVFEQLKAHNSHQAEFLQAAEEIFTLTNSCVRTTS